MLEIEFWETFGRIAGQEPDFMGKLIDIYFYTILLVIVVQHILTHRKK